MTKGYFENREILIPYDKVDRVSIRDSVAEVHTLSYSKPPVLRNKDAENFLNGLREYLNATAGNSKSPSTSAH